jgi:penicillin-binding protein A
MNISSSIRRLSLVFMALFIATSIGLVYWQVVVAQQVASNTIMTLGRKCLPDATAKRGRIFDRNGVLLAYSEPIPASTNNPNVGNLCVYQRVYTHPSMAPIIGYYVSPIFCAITPYCEAGVEKQFDDYLSGNVGITGLNNTVNKALHLPPVGDDIYLTIDVRIQDLVANNFHVEAPCPPGCNDVFTTDRGSVIVSDPHTGEILAMYSNPTYDNNRVATGDLDYLSSLLKAPEQPLLNRAINDCFVPGSTYKTLSLMAGLDSGKFTLDTPFYNDGLPNHLQALQVRLGEGNNTELFGPVGNNIDLYTHTYPVPLLYGYSHSDNIIFAQVGTNTGVTDWLNYNRAFYVGKQIPFDLPVNVSTVTPQPQKNLCATTAPPETALSVVQLAENSYGQGVDFMTPMQMSLFDNAAANDGQLMRPTLIEKIVDPSQSVLKSFSATSLGNPITGQTATEMRDAMYSVVACGSGSLNRVQLSYQYAPWSIIGKTGTGQVDVTGKTPAESWFITAAPYTYQSNDKPAITIVAMKENGGEGAYANGPMLRNIYNSIFSQGLIKVQQPPAPDPNFCTNTGLLGH